MAKLPEANFENFRFIQSNHPLFALTRFELDRLVQVDLVEVSLNMLSIFGFGSEFIKNLNIFDIQKKTRSSRDLNPVWSSLKSRLDKTRPRDVQKRV